MRTRGILRIPFISCTRGAERERGGAAVPKWRVKTNHRGQRYAYEEIQRREFRERGQMKFPEERGSKAWHYFQRNALSRATSIVPKILSADVLFPPASAIIALIARLFEYYLIPARGTSGDRPIQPRHRLPIFHYFSPSSLPLVFRPRPRQRHARRFRVSIAA